MSTKNMKRVVLGGAGLLILVIVILDMSSINSNILPEYVWQIIAFLSFPLLFLSLLTYWAKDELFHAWFNFAKWWVPVIVGVTVWLEAEGGGGGFGGGLAFFFLGSFYLILILGSLSAILHTHFTLKYKEQGKSTLGIDRAKNILNVLLYGSAGAFFLLLFM